MPRDDAPGRLAATVERLAGKIGERNIFHPQALESAARYIEGSQSYPPPLGFFYPSKGDYIGMVANVGSRRFLSNLKTGFEPAKSTRA